MFPGMHEFVQQDEPEIVETILAKCHAYYWCPIRIEHGRAIKFGVRQDRQQHQRNAFFGKEFLRQTRTALRPTQPCDIRKKVLVQRTVTPGTALLARGKRKFTNPAHPEPQVGLVGVWSGTISKSALQIQRSTLRLQVALNHVARC